MGQERDRLRGRRQRLDARLPGQPDGTYPFRPAMIETRKYFARAVVKAFAPDETVDPSITFTDLDTTQVFYRWANVAVKMGWMTRTADGDSCRTSPSR